MSRTAFARLRRDLLRARWRRTPVRLRLALGLLAAFAGAFAFWQLRLAYATVAEASGARAAGAAFLVTLLAIAVAGAAGTAVRFAARLRGVPDGPAWLALPVPPSELLRLLAWEAGVPMRAFAVFAAAACVAAAGIADPVAWVAGVVTFPVAWTGCRIAATAAVRALLLRDAVPAASDTAGARVTAALARRWSVRAPGRRGAPRRGGTWRRMPVPVALAWNELRVMRRAPAVHAVLATATALAIASIGAWAVPAPAVRASAFVLALGACAAFAETAIVTGGRGPFAVVRALPVAPVAQWLARATVPAIAVFALVAAHGAVARGPAVPLRVSLAWLAIAGLAMAAFASALQLTTFPNTIAARRVLALGLGVAAACSVMIPLLGWILLLAFTLHAVRRLPRWWALEDVA